MAYEAEGRLQEAISDYDLALRIDPNDAETYLHRGDAWFGLAEFDRAIHDSTEALQLAPDYG